MSTETEKIYDSPPSEPEDEFWLDQGRRMLAESVFSMRAAATGFIAALGVLQGIYLGILGFGKFIPERLALAAKMWFVLPLLLWLLALYWCIQAVMTRKISLFLHSPDDVREKSTQLILEKQRQLTAAFWLLAAGLAVAFILFILRLELS